MQTRKGISFDGILLLWGVRIPALLKVRSYVRTKNGKVEKVKSYYRNLKRSL